MCALRDVDGESVVPRTWLQGGVLDRVEAREVEWLWPGRVPLGKVTLLVGDPGRGKSLLALDMAARVTTGAPWPDQLETPDWRPETANPVGRVVLLSAEDDVRDTIRPRLDAAGGDPGLVAVVSAVRQEESSEDMPFSLGRDLPALSDLLSGLGDVRLVVLDPLSAYLAGLESGGNARMRGVLAPLVDLAARWGVAVLAISHLSKRARALALHRALGSVAYTACARAVWAVGPDPRLAERTLLLPMKNNLTGPVGALAYRIVPSARSRAVPVIAWESAPVSVTADEALAATGAPAPTRRERAEAWLADALAAGPVPCEEVGRRAREAGHSLMTLNRAKRDLGVEASREGFGASCTWRLPDETAALAGVAPGAAAPGGATSRTAQPGQTAEAH